MFKELRNDCICYVEKEQIKKRTKKILLEMKNTIFQSINTMNRIKSRSDTAEEKVSKCDNTAIH